MTNIKKAVFALMGCSLLFLLSAGPAKAGTCPAVGAATDCGVVLTITSGSGGVATAFGATFPGNGNPFDGIEDTLIGVVNSSGGTITSMTLTAATSANAFGFDHDGICTFSFTGNSYCPGGSTGYEGPNMTFGSVSSNGTTDSMTITFTNGGLADGTSTYFSLEGTPNSLQGGGLGGTPEPASIMLLGTGLVGLALRRFMA